MKIFIDNFFMFRTSFDDCLSNLSTILKRCREKNLTQNQEKCHSIVKKVVVLGHVISKDGIEVDKAKIDLIVNFFPPTCVKEIMSFLGHANFYYHFIKDFTSIAKPLSNLLTKYVPFHFFEECHVTFSKLKKALISALIFHPPS